MTAGNDLQTSAGEVEKCFTADHRHDFAAQPIVEASTRCVVAKEMLLRGPAGSAYESPLVLLEEAERRGLLEQLASKALDHALSLSQERLPNLLSFLNATPLSLLDDKMAERICALPTGQAERIILELNERDPFPDWCYLRQRMEELIKFGFRFALDDYGSGYSNLRAFAELPLHFIKSDNFFVRRMGQDRKTRFLFDTLVKTAHAESLSVVCEGVETEAMASLATCHGADLLQGYHFGHPVRLDSAVRNVSVLV